MASWMLTWLSATTFGIRSVEEREAGRGELHARVEVTGLSSFKAFSSARAWGRMNWHYSVLCRLGTVGFLSCCETARSREPLNVVKIFGFGLCRAVVNGVDRVRRKNLISQQLICSASNPG